MLAVVLKPHLSGNGVVKEMQQWWRQCDPLVHVCEFVPLYGWCVVWLWCIVWCRMAHLAQRQGLFVWLLKDSWRL
jgi:hypothetical protein